MRKLDYYWMTNESWYDQKENGVFVIRKDAPPEAQKSYEHYLEQAKKNLHKKTTS